MPKYKLLLLALVMVAVNGCTPETKRQEYITIGALLPLTGEDSDEGLRALNGLQLAKEEINENGGILGKKLDIIVLNDMGDEEYIVQQYNALKEKGVTAVIGSSYSGVTLALAKASEKDGLPVISPTASNPEVTRGRRNVFRAIFIDDYQAEAMAQFARVSLNAKTAVVFCDMNSDSFKHTAEVFTRSFTDRGGQVTAFDYFSDEDNLPVLFAALLRKYASNPPDVIFCPENYLPAAVLVNTAYETGFDNYILGSDAWDGLLAYVYHPNAMENVFYSAPFSFDDKDAGVSEFVRNYFESFSQMPLSGSAAAYNCVYILSQAINKAGNTDKNDIISAIKSNEFNLKTGRVKYDENNNPRVNVYVIQIKGGEYTTYEKLSL
jgi:branched-chain amino acid transport system substrate-binding protein